MKRKSTFIVIAALLLGAVSVGLVASPPLMVHEQAVHFQLNTLAAELLSHQKSKYQAYAEIWKHIKQLSDGGWDEDSPGVRVFRHFYHPISTDGYPGFKDAVSWAYDSGGLTLAGAISSYENDNSARAEDLKKDAYTSLGHVAHLIADMSQPDHVHLEPHIHETKYLPDDPFAWEPWVRDTYFDTQDWKQLSEQIKTMEPFYKGFQLDDSMKAMAWRAYRKSSFSGWLHKTKGPGNGATGELGEMFEVSYERLFTPPAQKIPATDTYKAREIQPPDVYGWIIRNKKKNTNMIAFLREDNDDGGGVFSGPSETNHPNLKYLVGDFYDIYTETGTRRPATDKPYKFYIEDIEHAIPAEFPVGVPNTSGHSLAYFYAHDLLPLAVRYIAGLYMHFYDIVNAPPYVKKVTAKQDGEVKYENEWKTKDNPAYIHIPKPWLVPAFQPSSHFLREPSSKNKSLPLDPEGKITLEITFSERVKGVKVTLEDFPDKSFDAVAKKSGSQGKVDSTIWEVTLEKKDLRNVIPPDSTTISRTLEITAKDVQNHLDSRSPLGDDLDSKPNSVAKATYEGVPHDPTRRNKYGWSGYTPGPDLNHKLTFGKPATPVMFLLDTSGSMGGGKMQQAQQSALQALQTMQENQEQGGQASVASIKTFGGPCNPQAALHPRLTFTTELDKVRTALAGTFPTGGATPLHLARTQAEAEVRTYLEETGIDEGSIVLLSDGMDTCGSTRPPGVYSRPPRTAVKRKTIPVKRGHKQQQHRANVRYLTVGFGLVPNSPADRDLQYLASGSGGRHFNAQNQRQLTRAFTKLLKAYIPKSATNPSALSPAGKKFLQTGSAALKSRNYGAARTAFAAYTKSAPADPAGVFNLALALEASDRYKSAAAQYRRYLQLATSATDRQKVEALIPELEQDYVEYFTYQVEMIKNDHVYLENYYQRLFNQSNATLAAEFSGFVREKGEFYRNLPDALELDTQWLKNDTRSLSSGINRIAKHIHDPTFDRDAVSLLAVPIKRLEAIVEKLEVEVNILAVDEE